MMSGEPRFITRNGRQVAVTLGPRPYDQLVEAVEDASDRIELHDARDEDNYVPWDEAKFELGLE